MNILQKSLIPNVLTFLRGVLVLVLIPLFLWEFPGHLWWAYFVFLLASFTDFLDGYLARKWEVVSDIGGLFDPLFDKVLTLSLFMLFVPFDIVPIWILVLMVVRELVVDGVKNFLSMKGIVVHAIKSAKAKTVCQIIFLNFGFFVLLFPGVVIWEHLALGFAVLALGLAYFSGWDYVYGRLGEYLRKG